MFIKPNALTEEWNKIIQAGEPASEQAVLLHLITQWQNSKEYKALLSAHDYYMGKQEILNYQRLVITPDGTSLEDKNLPNSPVVDNQYALIVDQKTNYIASKPFSYSSEDVEINEHLSHVFDYKFRRKFMKLVKNAINYGRGWLLYYYDEKMNLKSKLINPWEVLPIWADDEHEELEGVLRVYKSYIYEGNSFEQKEIQKVEYYTKTSVKRYILQNNQLIPAIENFESPYIVKINSQKETEVEAQGWGKVPFVSLRGNSLEMPLLRRVKTLQDLLNLMLTIYGNRSQEDTRNTVLVIKNYDGADGGEFRRNLAELGIIKVTDNGGVETLTVEIKPENYDYIIKTLKRGIIDNGRGFDVKDLQALTSPNQLMILSMYANIDLDANEIELEAQSTLREILFFVYSDYQKAISEELPQVDFTLNRDVLVNESEAITNCRNSVGMLSHQTILSMHPWVENVQEEEDRIREETASSEEEDIDLPFPRLTPPEEE